jgi:hypothetical protein
VQERRVLDVGAEGRDGAGAVGEQRGGERDGRVLVLADEEVTMVEGRGREFDEDLAGAWLGNRGVDQLEAGSVLASTDERSG